MLWRNYLDRKVEELKRLMNTVDGRDFIYNFFLDSCGVDFEVGIPSGIRDEYNVGVKKPAIDIFNLMVYHCPDKFKLMLDEQQMRRENSE